jgi:hypothetical protein
LPAGGRGQICRARERFIRRGLVHTHGRRRRPVRGPGYHSFIAIFASGSGAAPRHVSAAAGATRWSHPSPTECGRAHPSAGGNARPAHRGFDHMDRATHGTGSTDATSGMPNRAARLSGDRTMTGRRRRIERGRRFRSQIIAETQPFLSAFLGTNFLQESHLYFLAVSANQRRSSSIQSCLLKAFWIWIWIGGATF